MIYQFGWIPGIGSYRLLGRRLFNLVPRVLSFPFPGARGRETLENAGHVSPIIWEMTKDNITSLSRSREREGEDPGNEVGDYSPCHSEKRNIM